MHAGSKKISLPSDWYHICLIDACRFRSQQNTRIPYLTMKKLHLLLLIQLMLFVSLSSRATDYYFSNSGSDDNSGTSESSPFKSLTKASSLRLVPGDKLLFRRGDIFRGELKVYYSGTAASPIVLTSYGEGPDAIISGSEYINNWTSVGNGIYKATCPVFPQMIFLNGKSQTLARYPNKGFLFTDAGNGTTGFTDNDLPDHSNLYVGAGVQIRTARFRYEERTVAAQSGTNLTFNKPTDAAIVAGAGYYLTNKFEFIDTAGEYSYDAVNHQLYFKSLNALPPSDNSIEASQYDNGIQLSSTANIQIQDLKIEHQQKNGIYLLGNPTANLSISQCVFQNIFLYAITGGNKDQLTISNNEFLDIWNEAIYLGGVTNLIISNNIFKRIGIADPGRATDNRISYMCMDMNNSNGTISDNRIDSIGYNGIHYFQNTLIERNIITRFCMSIDDGAGIVAHGTANGIRNGTGCIVRHNIVSDAIGNATSYPLLSEPFVNGIGMDDNSGNAVIENNTVYNIAGRGISIHNSTGNQILSNTVFNCNNGSLVFEHDYNGGMLSNNISNGNILYNIHDNEYALRVQNWNESETGLNFGAFSGNYYINPYADAPIYTAQYGNDENGAYGLIQKEYSARGWMDKNDAAGKERPLKLQNYKVDTYTGNNLVTNGNFDNNIDGWGCYADNFTCSSIWQNNALLDGGSVKVTSPSFKYGNFYNTNLISLQKDKQYLLSYSVIGDENKIAAFNIQDRSNWAQLTPVVKKEVSTKRINHQLLVTPSAATTAGQLTFYIGPEYITSFSLDNIKLQEVTTTPIDPLQQNRFFVNATNATQTVSLEGIYLDIDSNVVIGSVQIDPYSSKILIVVSESALPLHLLDIAAKPVGNNHCLITWNIASTTEDYTMELQKSIDGLNFKTIRSMPGIPNRANYQYTDSAFEVTAYYRIKTTMADGQVQYSKAVKASNEGTVLSVYPNPLTGNTLYITNGSNYESATILTTEGKVLLKAKIHEGFNSLTLPPAVSKGVYLLRLNGRQFLKTVKIVRK